MLHTCTGTRQKLHLSLRHQCLVIDCQPNWVQTMAVRDPSNGGVRRDNAIHSN